MTFKSGKYSYEITSSEKVTVKLHRKDSPASDYCEVSIKSITCTCSDFIERRSSFAQDDPRRLCRHLVDVMENVELPHFLKPYKELIEWTAGGAGGFPLYSHKQSTIINGQKAELFMNRTVPLREGQINWVGLVYGSDCFMCSPDGEIWVQKKAPSNKEQVAAWIKFSQK